MNQVVKDSETAWWRKTSLGILAGGEARTDAYEESESMAF